MCIESRERKRERIGNGTMDPRERTGNPRGSLPRVGCRAGNASYRVRVELIIVRELTEQ